MKSTVSLALLVFASFTVGCGSSTPVPDGIQGSSTAIESAAPSPSWLARASSQIAAREYWASESFPYGFLQAGNRLCFVGCYDIGPHRVWQPEFEIAFSIRDAVQAFLL